MQSVPNICQLLARGQWFSPGPPVSSSDKTDRHDITEILLKVVLNTTKQTNKHVIVTDWDRGVQARRTPEPVQSVHRDRVAVEVLKARARMFILLEPEIEVGNWLTL